VAAAAENLHPPITVAIVGAGPAGFYAAEALLDRTANLRIDVLERLPSPYGLIRAGVAPDHQSTKQVVRRFEQTALHEILHFYGNVDVGTSVSLSELRGFYDAVVLAVGAGLDRPLGIPGEQLRGCYGSAVFVGWYNGHPDFHDLCPQLNTDRVVVIGNGNVALDVARVLVKSPAEMATSDMPDAVVHAIADSGIREVVIVGRRGAGDTKFTTAELREIGDLADCDVVVDPAALDDQPDPSVPDRERRVREKNLAVLRALAAGQTGHKSKRLRFCFHLAPVEIEGQAKVEAVRFERTIIRDNRLVGTGETERMACGMVVAATGYRTARLSELPYDVNRGLFPSDDGRIAHGLYVVGWAKRGPIGVIGSNKPDGSRCADQILADLSSGRQRKVGRPALERCLRSRGIHPVTFDDWLKIDAAEVAHAKGSAPRKKLTSLGEMLAVLTRGTPGAVGLQEIPAEKPVSSRRGTR
jgi:NADPH-dependent glutamate synthase beta subunit-like oxidoreductase